MHGKDEISGGWAIFWAQCFMRGNTLDLLYIIYIFRFTS